MSELVTVRSGAGDKFEIAGARWTWKVRGENSDGAFCFFEQRLEPGEGVPLHFHHYAEAFYILEGVLQFHSGDSDLISSHSNGDVVLARPGVRHAFINKSTEPARLLSISAAAHQAFFDAIAAADQERPFSGMALPDAFARVVAVGTVTDTLFILPETRPSDE